MRKWAGSFQRPSDDKKDVLFQVLVELLLDLVHEGVFAALNFLGGEIRKASVRSNTGSVRALNPAEQAPRPELWKGTAANASDRGLKTVFLIATKAVF
jgi:hypothetical protein